MSSRTANVRRLVNVDPRHEHLTRILGSDDMLGVIGRDTPVHLLNISGSGCLLESRARVEAGTVGTLQVTVDADIYCDDVRVARCQRIEGAGGLYHLGVEYLWTSSPGQNSLRRLVTRLRGAVAHGLDVRFDLRRA
jgi:hypothetical protein